MNFEPLEFFDILFFLKKMKKYTFQLVVTIIFERARENAIREAYTSFDNFFFDNYSMNTMISYH